MSTKMPRSAVSSALSQPAEKKEETDDAFVASVTAQRIANTFLERYNRSELQELLALSSCSWLLPSEEFHFPVELPKGIIGQLQNFSYSNLIILAPVETQITLDYKEVHQIVRDLVTGIYCMNQIPSIRLDANYDNSTLCQLPPAYYDTRVGQILISVDYMMKALWHGSFIAKEKRARILELWRSSIEIDANGVPQMKKKYFAEFLAAGLTDISEDSDFDGIYSIDLNTDPTYEPNSPEEKRLFMEYSEDILLKLTCYTTQVKQHNNLFMYDATYNLTNALRTAGKEQLDETTYQRLQKRIILQQMVVGKYLEKKMEIRKNLAYLKFISFLTPLLIALKKKMKIPDIMHLLPPYSDGKLKTERELPPLSSGPGFKCQHFPYEQNEFFHLHGGIELDIGTPSVEDVTDEIKAAFGDIQCFAASHLSQLLDPEATYRQSFPLPIMNFDGKSYYVISIELETFYQQFNRTQWWTAMSDVMRTHKSKRLPVNDIQMHELFKKRYGNKKAIKCKSLPHGLKLAAERGLAAIFYTYCRKNLPSCLSFLDEAGYTLVHLAAIYNSVPVICQLAMAGFNLNQQRSDNFKCHGRQQTSSLQHVKERTGPTALHLAAQCGSLEALLCLLALQVNYKITDNRGWTAVHFAAFHDNVGCIRALLRKDPTLLEMETIPDCQTPLLLAATSGALDSIQYFMSVGANWRKTDGNGNNMVTLATLNIHSEILKYLIELHLPELPVWNLLVEMLICDDGQKKEMAVRCMEILCLAKTSYWKNILDAGGIPALVELLGCPDINLQCISSAVLCNISQEPLVSRTLSAVGAIPVVIQLLHSEQAELHSRCSLILADMARIDNNQNVITELGGIPPLVKLLHTNIEDVLVNVVNCIQVLCANNLANRSLFQKEGAIPPLIQLLSIKSDVLQTAAAAALAELARDHKENQVAIATGGAINSLVNIVSGRKLSVQVKAALAIGVLADGSPNIQEHFLSTHVVKHLLKLLKIFQLDVKEQGAVTLWTLAGATIKQQKLMAEQIGYYFIFDMLLSSSDKMQYVGCQAILALGQESKVNQDEICKENGVHLLVRLLRSLKTTERTLLSVITALGTLCIGVAHTNNPNSQQKIVEEQALPILVNLLKHHSSLQVKVEAACTLGCIVLGNTSLQVALKEKEDFSYTDVLELLQSSNQSICLQAGYALALFAYNNTLQQFLILQAGGIQFSAFESFLQSPVETEKAKAAFQSGQVVFGGWGYDEEPVFKLSKEDSLPIAAVASLDKRGDISQVQNKRELIFFLVFSMWQVK
ncbi:ankyrin and armadillo repeat-containing protein-like [Protopterus annectens]|uniref:ankyrin and armadillo repeat-containing protein-like n=1 Tax=Protopterus annectens TaxID=7888 RepID=UPI001CFBBF83|nr:ankyrin and armadillo repeat-containing protein-like [Protopterus annectens]